MKRSYRFANSYSKSEISVFYSDYSDFIDRVTIDSSTYQYQNIGKANIKGVELSSRIMVSDVFDLPEGYQPALLPVIQKVKMATNSHLTRLTHGMQSRHSIMTHQTILGEAA